MRALTHAVPSDTVEAFRSISLVAVDPWEAPTHLPSGQDRESVTPTGGTKSHQGDAMESVRDIHPPAGWVGIAAATLSCSKLGGNWFAGSPNLNCGLCVPCMVRRATFIKANVDDNTQYLFQAISGTHLSDLIDARRGDIEAVRYAIEAGVDVDAIDSGTWPPDYDLDRVESLVQRGLDELALLELP